MTRRDRRTMRDELGLHAFLDLMAENRERANTAWLVRVLRMRLGLR